MSNRYSNVEKHSCHSEEQCALRRSARNEAKCESALALKNNRECCAPYQTSHKSSPHYSGRRLLATKAMVASSPDMRAESSWHIGQSPCLNLSDNPSTRRSPCSALRGKRDLTLNSSVLGLTQERQVGRRGDGGDASSCLSSSVLSDYAFRLLPGRLRETEFNFEQTKINKIFASEWLNERQVVLGTKCNQLLVFDFLSHQISHIPMLKSSGRFRTADPPCGIHSISINPSRTLLATGAHSTNDIAVYSLPTFDPVCVCEGGHEDWVFGVDWIDDEFFVSGSRDSNICLYRVQQNSLTQSFIRNKSRHQKTSPQRINRSTSNQPLVSSPSCEEATTTATVNQREWTTVSPRPIRDSSRPVESTSRLESAEETSMTSRETFVLGWSESDSSEDSTRLDSDEERGNDSSNDNDDQNENRLQASSLQASSPLEFLRLHRTTAADRISETENWLMQRRIRDRRALHYGHSESERLHGNILGNLEHQSPLSVTSPFPNFSRRRPVLTPTRRTPAPVNDLDMDQIEDEQDEEGQINTPRQVRGLPLHPCITPLDTINCDRAEKVRAVAYNSWNKQIATLSLNAFFHLIDVYTFRPSCEPLRLPHQRENVCMSVNEDGTRYAVGSQSYVTFVDPRIPKLSATRSILCKQRGCGIRSLSFRNEILTIGTGQGTVYFYDVRADKYLDLHCGATVQLEAGVGWLHHDDTYHDFFVGHDYPNAIYTHSYDPAGTRLFTAGGPLPAGLYGNYAAIWQ